MASIAAAASSVRVMIVSVMIVHAAAGAVE
jgi:hypothetical protein